jgi:16S rRNA (guanine966-N2)-methyltransferase
MRIISGRSKGTKLETLQGNNTRPTLDRVKESLFNIIQNNIKDSIFVDVFAGSASIGLEAASRGATKVLMCDNSKEAIKVIQRNIEKTHLEEVVKIYNMNFEQFISTKISEKVDIVYIDPPYNSNYAIQTVKMLIEKDLLKEKSIIIIETDNEERILNDLENINVKLTDKRKYGRAHILFLAKI